MKKSATPQRASRSPKPGFTIAARKGPFAPVEQAVAAMGGLDTLVPCAGISAFHPLEGHDDAYFLRVMEVNLVAVFRLVRDATPHLKAAGNGRIVTIGSTDGDKVEAARERILMIVDPPKAEVGATYAGRVVNITKFGAFVNILPGRDGLVHISKLGKGKRINNVEDVLTLGQEIEVIVEVEDGPARRAAAGKPAARKAAPKAKKKSARKKKR